VEELIVEVRQLRTEDLMHLALIHPARALQRIDPTQQIVVLIDALDEIRYHQTAQNILDWLTNCPELPENVRFVLTSRAPDEALKVFSNKQAAHLALLAMTEDDSRVKQDCRRPDPPRATSTVGDPEWSRTARLNARCPPSDRVGAEVSERRLDRTADTIF
jgi:hypothetical protein